MELKNAVAVCLISLCSATIVVLIARALDSQAASQLEPQLTAIAEELHAIRKQGGIGAPPSDVAADDVADAGLVVYYLHSSYRCPTCRTVEAQAKKIVETEFARQLERGEIAFKSVDYEKGAGAKLAREFKVNSAVVVLVAMKDGKIDRSRSKRLDKVLPLAARDVAALDAYLRDEIKAILPAEVKATDPASKGDAPAIPTPKADSAPSDSAPPSIPIPE
jgi:hypothetical protein